MLRVELTLQQTRMYNEISLQQKKIDALTLERGTLTAKNEELNQLLSKAR